MKRRSHCLAYALHKWRAEGGYILLRKSVHWSTPHVMHLSADRSVLTHFTPIDPPTHPFRPFLGGFDGEIRFEDTAPAPPMSRVGILLGIVALLILGAIWAFEDPREM